MEQILPDSWTQDWTGLSRSQDWTGLDWVGLAWLQGEDETDHLHTPAEEQQNPTGKRFLCISKHFFFR